MSDVFFQEFSSIQIFSTWSNTNIFDSASSYSELF